MARYRMYVDETGDHSLRSIKDSFNKYLSLTGIIIKADNAVNHLYPSFESLKQKYFPHHCKDNPVVFHRTDIVARRGPFACLQDEEIRQQFDLDLLLSMMEAEFEIVTVLIDKDKFNRKYTKWKTDTYHYCMRCLVERFHRHLYTNKGVGDIMFETRNPNADKKLANSYRRIYNGGTENVKAHHLQTTLTSGELKLSNKKKNIAGVQLADLLAFPSRRFLLDHYKIQPIIEYTHADTIIDTVIKPKLRRWKGDIEGIGIKLLP